MVWNNNPETINQIDRSMPSYYIEKITTLHKNAVNAKEGKIKFKQYEILKNTLNGITSLHRYYHLYTESQIFIIDYLAENNQIKRAKNIAEKWQKNAPFDFNAKFKYTDILTQIDSQYALNYLASVYKTHPDIIELNHKYFNLLLETENIEQALQLAEDSQKYSFDMALDFMYYFTNDANKTYSPGASIKVLRQNILIIDNQYQVITKYNFNGLQRLRFDIDNLSIGSQLKHLNFEILSENKSYFKVKSHPLNNIHIKDRELTTTSNDPYLEIELPEELIGNKQVIEIIATIEIEKTPNLVINKITRHDSWIIYFSDTLNFNKENSKHFNLNKTNNNYQSIFSVNQQNIQYIKIDLLPYKNFKLKQLSTRINDSLDLTYKQLVQLKSVTQVDDEILLISGEKPSIVYKLKQPLNLNNILISVKFGK